ncbi:hypothetical protein CTAM01_16802, partial [Colletotrichum tamarilloi]
MTVTLHLDTSQVPLPGSMLDNATARHSETKTASINEVQAIYNRLVVAENERYKAIPTQYSQPDSVLSHEQWKDIVACHYTLLSNTLEQLFFYTKSLCVRVPFLDARDSLAVFFKQNMDEVSGTSVVSTNSYGFNETPDIKLTNEVAVSLDPSRVDDGTEILDHLESEGMIHLALAVDLEDSDMVMIDIMTPDADELGCMEQESPVAIAVPLHDEEVTGAMDITTVFVRAHGLLFSEKDHNQFIAQSKILTRHLAASACQWTEHGYHISIVLHCALLEYGSESNPIMRIIKQGRGDEGDMAVSDTPNFDERQTVPTQRFNDALEFISRAHRAVFGLPGDEMAYPYLHVTLVFLHHMSQFPDAMAYIEEKMPWKRISLCLNSAMKSCSS